MEEMCFSEEVVQALLEHFVEPFLPSCRTRQTPTPSQHQTVAKQMHAVVLLYNYYHRKQYQESEFLDFTSFCKLAIVLKPNLMAYMKLMHQADYSMMDDFENKLSQTEKAIHCACNISTALDASKSVPVTDDWTVSKVAVFLVNLRRQNCMLLESDITHGIISIIEKDLEGSSIRAHNTFESECKDKQTGTAELILNNFEKNDDNDQFLDLAFSAVKNVAGIGKRDLVVLETHIVYSLNKPKAAARLYLMQNTQSNNGDTWPHIKDIIGSLQGPLVKRSSNGWMVTSFVKYFHMLPYMEALSDWISREVSSKGFPNHNSELELLPLTGDQTAVNSCGKLITQVGVNSSPDDIAEESLCDSPKTRSNKLARKNNYREFQTVDFSEQVDGPVCKDVHGSGAVFSQRGIESQNYSSAAEVYCRLKNSLPLKEDHRMTSGNCVTEEDIGESLSKPCDDGCNNDMIFMQGGGSCMESLISQNQHHERLNATSTSGNASSRTILRILYHLRQKLCEQHERVSAEILRCDMDIDAALNELTKDTDNPHLEKEEVQQRTSQPLEEESLSEAIVSVKNHCKKLDELCRQMKWKLPTYQVFPYRDGFAANVMVKEGCHVCQGSVCPNPSEARENAASYMMAKLSEAKLLAT
ncbi:unnamed protein product [Cuscuta epithymum]|uniref:DRBM domain-containing protein n=1 Tax=Cuscuta epithymum TaxID=186058 RepID=A0AAV0EK62_9ASTE|nr:unnamed protein product [Cuscuta epithymum]